MMYLKIVSKRMYLVSNDHSSVSHGMNLKRITAVSHNVKYNWPNCKR